MFNEFTRIAHADGQVPVVLLIQSRDPADPDLDALLAADLDATAIPYLSTVTLLPTLDHAAFVADGHYTPQTNMIFGTALLDLIDGKAP